MNGTKRFRENLSGDMRPFTCPVCGETYLRPLGGDWGYFISKGQSRKAVCSWKCKRAYERAEAAKPKGEKPRRIHPLRLWTASEEGARARLRELQEKLQACRQARAAGDESALLRNRIHYLRKRCREAEDVLSGFTFPFSAAPESSAQKPENTEAQSARKLS